MLIVASFFPSSSNSARKVATWGKLIAEGVHVIENAASHDWVLRFLIQRSPNFSNSQDTQLGQPGAGEMLMRIGLRRNMQGLDGEGEERVIGEVNKSVVERLRKP